MNTLAPINRIPPEILSLIPDFWRNDGTRGQNVIALTHVSLYAGIGGIFSHRVPLSGLIWAARTQTRLALTLNARSPPPSTWKYRGKENCALDSLFQIGPSAVRRFDSLEMLATPKIFRVIAAQFSHPTPLLKSLTIEIESPSPWRSPLIGTTYFNGDLSSLCELDLQCVRTELPWRKMVNLTSFILAYTPPGETSTGHLLDFLESAPRLRKFELY